MRHWKTAPGVFSASGSLSVLERAARGVFPSDTSPTPFKLSDWADNGASELLVRTGTGRVLATGRAYTGT